MDKYAPLNTLNGSYPFQVKWRGSKIVWQTTAATCTVALCTVATMWTDSDCFNKRVRQVVFSLDYHNTLKQRS
jgi:hypothetical protein